MLFSLRALVLFSVVTAVSCVSRDLLLSRTRGNTDEITNLPGLVDVLPFRQFGGYIDLPNSKKHIFYWLVESKNDPVNDPVVLWTNGGPGCSGLLGFLTEHGPFRPLKNGTLYINPFSWNANASLVYFEQPAGVGFSYSDDPSDYFTGDATAAADNYQFILQFLQKYPNLAKNDFYISSESYGGHYMPTLAKYIVQHNVDGNINFKGFAVGNPLTNMIENAHGMYDTFAGHAVVARPLFQQWSAKCGKSDASPDCTELETKMQTEAGPQNPYAIDYPVCNSQQQVGRSQRAWLLHHLHQGKPQAFKDAMGLIPPSDYQPCEQDYVTAYLNTDAVKAAIHAKPNITWVMCSSQIQYSPDDVRTDMVPIYKFLLQGNFGLKILIFSGDDDSICGALGTETWIWDAGVAVKNDWTPWMFNDTEYGTQIGGYITKFDGFSFATVHGAGHEVPAYRPQPALALFNKFLSGEVF